MSLEKAMHKKNRNPRDFYQMPGVSYEIQVDLIEIAKKIGMLT
jgi:hypothetical protein